MITASHMPLGQFFPNNFFTIPSFQRPYVWGKDQIETLLEDLRAANNANLPDYFIGNVVFYTGFVNNFNVAVILDGQQRLTTLFLLFAVLRDRLSNPFVQTLLEFNASGVQRDKIEFDIRPDVTKFIKSHVVTSGGTTLAAPKTSDKSVLHMAEALKIMHDWFSSNSSVNESAIHQYLLQNVFIVSVASTNISDALRLFMVLNDRGIKLSAGDILKANNLAEVPPASQSTYAQNWEAIENDFEEDEFDIFLMHLRMILVKSKAQKNLLDEFKDIYSNGLLKKGQDTFDFIDKYKRHYDALFDCSNASDFTLCNIVRLLSKSGKSNIWVPVALFYMEKFGTSNLLDFMELLEKKFSADWFNGLSLTPRITNMSNILKAIDAHATTTALFSDAALAYSKNFINIFQVSDLYGTAYAPYVLAKLCYVLGTPEMALMQFQGTIEHILPQNPAPSSSWYTSFTQQQMDDWKHKLGNLILLDRRKNTALSNLDFQQKKSKYFGSKINLYPLSLHIMNGRTTWTPTDLQANHNAMINLLDTNY